MKEGRADGIWIKEQGERSCEGKEFFFASFGQKKRQVCIQCNVTTDSSECKRVVAWAVSVIKFSYRTELLSTHTHYLKQ